MSNKNTFSQIYKEGLSTLLLALLMVFPASAQFADGDGTESDPWQIATLEQLQAAGESENLDKHFILINDIDAEGTADWDDGKGFDPIGWWENASDNKVFSGSFDGNGFTITHLTINRAEEDRIGLFGYVDGAILKNITLDNLHVTGDRYVGGLAGYMSGGEINGITVSGSAVSGNARIGGITGFSTGTLTGVLYSGSVTGGSTAGGISGTNIGSITDASFSGSVSGESYVGGLTGGNSGEIHHSSASGAISGRVAGGLAGFNEVGSIYQSETNIEITNESDYSGGLIGITVEGSVHASSAIGKVSGNNLVGGLIGENMGTKIYDSYAHADVTGNSMAGGLIGRHSDGPVPLPVPPKPGVKGELSGSYATGSVSGNEMTGGLIGKSQAAVTSSYWDTESTGQNQGAGDGNPGESTGLSTGQMTGQNAYIFMHELDFDETWQLTEGYPVLAWQEPDDAVDQPVVSLIVVHPLSYDYGGVGTSASRVSEFTIENRGNMNLEGHAELAGPDAGQFELVAETASFSIEPDSTHIVEVVFQPEQEDHFNAVLEVHHNASNEENPLEVILEGEGLDLDFAGGSGIEEDPWQVATLEHLDEVRRVPYDWFIQTTNIDAIATEGWDDGLGFEPISVFTGHFDGDGYVISHLAIHREEQDQTGLFGRVGDGGVLRNITLEDMVVHGKNHVGGLVGLNQGDVYFSHTEGMVSGRSSVGGMIGSNSRWGSLVGNVFGSSSGADVAGQYYSGGLVGFNYGEVEQCFASGEVSAVEYRAGGLVGQNGDGPPLEGFHGGILNSYATGSVSGQSESGGLVGRHQLGEIQSTYAIGEVSGNSDIGGLIGVNSSTVLQSYWDMQSSGRSAGAGSGRSNGITGLTRSEMTQQANYENWDFEDVWTILEGRSYPWLQSIPDSILVSAGEPYTDIPLEFKLRNNYPNPFNPVTTIRYDLPEQMEVRLEIFDILGRRVVTLVDEEQRPGTHHAVWDASQVASGVYIYQIRAGGYIQSRQLTVIK